MRMSEQLYVRALELAERGRGATRPSPVVGAGDRRGRRDGRRGLAREERRPHAEIAALEQAGERALRRDAYVTLEPCSHHGRTPPCADAVVEAGVDACLVAAARPEPEVDGRGLKRIAEAGSRSSSVESTSRAPQNEAWRVWKPLGRPFVSTRRRSRSTGASRSGPRWVSGEASRRRVHELRAASDAVAVGMGTVLRRRAPARRPGRRADAPASAASPSAKARSRRDRSSSSDPARSPRSLPRSRRKVSSRCCSKAVRHSRPPFLEAGLVDKLLVFLTPHLAGAGPSLLGELSSPLKLSRLSAEPVGEDVLISAYIHEP